MRDFLERKLPNLHFDGVTRSALESYAQIMNLESDCERFSVVQYDSGNHWRTDVMLPQELDDELESFDAQILSEFAILRDETGLTIELV